MSLPRFSVHNRVLVNMLMLVILVGGAMFALTLVREMFPESRPNKLAITAVYPGVQPQEIEKAVTIKIEEAVRDIEGIEKVDSSIAEGLSMTMLTLFNEVDDVDRVVQEVKNEIDALQELPDDLERLTLNKLEPKLPVISVAIYGEGSEASLKRAARSLRDELLLLPGISDVEISGTRDDEISIEVRPERLLEYDITFDEVAQAIRQTNLDISGGELKGDRTSVAVRTLGERTRGIDLEDIVVRTQVDGSQVSLSDVAIIHDHFVESDLESYFNSQPAVHCVVYKTPSQDAIQIATLVKALIHGKRNESFDPFGQVAALERAWYMRPFALLNAKMAQWAHQVSGRPDPWEIYERSRLTPFPHDFQVALHTDLSRFVEGRLDLMLRNGRSGLVLVLICLVLFLNWRVAFWAALGLPIAFLGTFVVMWALGVTINLVSMFGMIIVLGILVDDAIVIGENVYRHIEEGSPPQEAAIRGAEEVMWPITIAVLTTIAAFAPLFFIRGQIGDFMGQLPTVVLAALSMSLIEALLILPAHLAELPARHARRTGKSDRKTPPPSDHRRKRMLAWLSRFSHERVADAYEKLLRFALRWRYVTIAAAVASLLVSMGLFAGGIVESIFVQKMDSETLVCALEMPVGTNSDRVKERLRILSDRAVQMPEVSNVQMIVGRQYDIAGAGSMGRSDQSHLGQLIIELEAADLREQRNQRSSQQIMAELRKVSETLPGVNSVSWEGLNGGPGGKAIVISIAGDDFQELLVVADELKAELAGYQGVFDLDDNFDQGKREVQVRLRDAARSTGITVGRLGSYVRSALYGQEARRITRQREDVRIMVRYPERFRESVYHLESMWIPTGSVIGERGWVPLKEVAELREAASYATIHRSQQRRSVEVLADVDQEIASTFDILQKVHETFDRDIQPRHPNVQIEFLGSYEEQQKAFSGLKLAFTIALLMIYMMLAGLFRSYFQPIVVMAAIPFAIQGAIIGHWITGNPFTILSQIGLVALAGIVVNDSLVLIDFINKRVRQGFSDFEASIQGARLRLRAILLTTLTTAVGLTPLMFETSFQAKFLIPMAVTLTFGLIFATILTLITVPAINLVFFDIRSLVRSWFNRSTEIDEHDGAEQSGMQGESAL